MADSSGGCSTFVVNRSPVYPLVPTGPSRCRVPASPRPIYGTRAFCGAYR